MQLQKEKKKSGTITREEQVLREDNKGDAVEKSRGKGQKKKWKNCG